MKPVVLQQLVRPGRAIRSIVTPVGVKKDSSHCVSTVALPAQTKLSDGRFYDRQWIAATAFARVNMNRKTGFLRKEPDERRVSDFAIAFAAHENAPALRAMAIAPRH